MSTDSNSMFPPRLSRRALLGRAMMASSALALPAVFSGCSSADPVVTDARDQGVRVDPMSPDRLHGWVRELCAFQPRWAGYPAERQAAQWLAEHMRHAGLDTQIEPYGFRRWELNEWEVRLQVDGSDQDINSFPMWSTHAGRGTAELVDVGLGTELELVTRNIAGKAVVVTGKALLNVFATYPDTYQRAAELGAAAMFVTSDAPDNLIRPTSSSQNYLDDNPIPAFQLGARDLARLRAASRDGGTVSWNLDARHVNGTTHDVVGFLPGSGALEGSVVICAHYDAWFTGALDNATGVAGLIGLAEHFGALDIAERPRDMLFLGVTGHDTGFPYGGMSNWLSKYPDNVPDIDLFVNLDHLAAHGEEHVSGAGIIDMLGLSIERPGDEERALFTTKHPVLGLAFLPYLLQYGLLAAYLPTVPEVNANRDLEGAMGEMGVPSVNLTMATPHYHTVEDTPDRIPAEQLSRAVQAHRDFITDVMGMARSQIRAPF